MSGHPKVKTSQSSVRHAKVRTGIALDRTESDLWRLVVNNFAGCRHSNSQHPYVRSDDTGLNNMHGIDVCRFRLQPNRQFSYYAHTSGAPPEGTS